MDSRNHYIRLRQATLHMLLLMAWCVLAGSALAPETSAATDRETFAGIYELSNGMLVYIQPRGGDGKLVYCNDAGEVRELSPVSENTYSAGPGVFLSEPVEFELTFHRSAQGSVESLTWQQPGHTAILGRKLPIYQREDVKFTNGGVRLAGTLRVPRGTKPHPALVLLHGTGPEDRNNLLPLVHFLAREGIALFSYDKRGVAGSTGNERRASLDDLAGDAAAAVRYLKSREEIDHTRIGLFGVSQGGWVAPLAASRSNDVAFVISVSGPGISPAELTRNRLKHQMHEEGFPEDQVARALSLMQLRDDFARGKANWETLQAAVRQARDLSWYPSIPMPLSEDSYREDHWPRILDYNPAPVLENLRVPVLALFGSLDDRVLAEENSEKWKAALERGGNRDHTIKVFPKANHMLLKAETGNLDEYPKLKRFVPEYAPFLLSWLRDRRLIQ